MRKNRQNPLALAVLVAAVSGCAGNSGDYPSLALRPFERGEVAVAPGPPPPPPPIRVPTSPAQLASLRADVAAAQTAFQTAEGTAARLARAAAGTSASSNARASALVALADLDAQRGRTALALAAVDTLAAEAAAALNPDPVLAEAQSEIAATLAGQDATIARLWRTIES